MIYAHVCAQVCGELCWVRFCEKKLAKQVEPECIEFSFNSSVASVSTVSNCCFIIMTMKLYPLNTKFRNPYKFHAEFQVVFEDAAAVAGIVVAVAVADAAVAVVEVPIAVTTVALVIITVLDAVTAVSHHCKSIVEHRNA